MGERFLSQITPVILTYNEAANIGRCLTHLDWADEIVVLDSFSTDATAAICAANPKVRFVQRAFDSHAAQWSFAKDETGVRTPWVLALDCDYVVTEAARAEVAALAPAEPIAAYRFPFRYAVMGRVLRSGLYPPVMALYRRALVRYVQDGHTQRLVPSGEVVAMHAFLVHDDRKPLDHWMAAQFRYARLEAEKLAAGAPGAKGWLRTKTPLSPLLMGLYCLARGGLLEGPAGWLYAGQRTLAEAMIVCALLDKRLRD